MYLNLNIFQVHDFTYFRLLPSNMISVSDNYGPDLFWNRFCLVHNFRSPYVINLASVKLSISFVTSLVDVAMSLASAAKRSLQAMLVLAKILILNCWWSRRLPFVWNSNLMHFFQVSKEQKEQGLRHKVVLSHWLHQRNLKVPHHKWQTFFWWYKMKNFSILSGMQYFLKTFHNTSWFPLSKALIRLTKTMECFWFLITFSTGWEKYQRFHYLIRNNSVFR